MSRREILSQHERATIETSIAAAERATSAEFVVVVARQSGRYDRGEDLFGFVLAIITALIVTAAWPLPTEHGSWDDRLHSPLGVGGVLALIAGVSVLGALIASRVWPIARLFTPRRVMLEQVRRRGADCFVRLGVATTTRRDGVLVYVSVLERMVWVTADDAVRAAIGEEAWGPIKDEIVREAKAGKLAEGLRLGIEHAGRKLAEKLPAKAGQEGKNELSNVVHVVP